MRKTEVWAAARASARAAAAAVIVLLVSAGRCVHAQSEGPGMVAPMGAAGVAVIEFDVLGEQAYRGTFLRAGAQIGWLVDVAVLGEYWPDLGGYRGFTLALGGTVYPVGKRRVAPYVTVDLGYFRADPKIAGTLSPIRGPLRALTLGVRGHVTHGVGVGVEANARVDANHFDDGIRAYAFFAPAVRPPAVGQPPSHVSVQVGGLSVIAGPWHLVEPVYQVGFETPLDSTRALGIDLALLHWDIRSPSTPFPIWDTRAVLADVLLRWRPGGTAGVVSVGGGPLTSLMLEGPDVGIRTGAAVAFDARLPLGAFAPVFSVKYVWIHRSDAGATSEVSGADQRGIVMAGGIGF